VCTHHSQHNNHMRPMRATNTLYTPSKERNFSKIHFFHATELEDEDERLSGSTATVALVRRDKIIVANVGDSRAVLCRNGRPVDLSTEHR
jgi:serine/threonine protein phosphatase PrpC